MYFKAVFHAELERGKKDAYFSVNQIQFKLTDVAFHCDLIL